MSAIAVDPIARREGEGPRGRRWVWWLMVVALIGAGLSILGVAEAVWLEEALPRDHAARTSLVVVPGPGFAAASPAWTEALGRQATQDQVLARVIQGLGLRNEKTGEALSTPELRKGVRFSVQCMEFSEGSNATVRGALVSATFRGFEKGTVSRLAEAWSKEYLKADPAVALPAPAGALASYVPCKGF